jgi:hypothetical protein
MRIKVAVSSMIDGGRKLVEVEEVSVSGQSVPIPDGSWVE